MTLRGSRISLPLQKRMKSSVQAKVQLVWLYHIQRPVLCLNLLREIAEYLTLSARLLGYSGDLLRIYQVPENYTKTVTLSISFTDGIRNCWLSPRTALLVGGGSYLHHLPVTADVFLLDAQVCSVTQQMSMSEARFSPGLICVNGVALVFGGYNGSPLATCEKFNSEIKTWASLPCMSTPKYSFSPVQYRNKVYLPCIVTVKSVLEAFLPEENRFEVAQMELPTSSNCSLAFMHEDVLVVLSCNNFLWHWNPTTNKSGRSGLEYKNSRLSSCPVAVVEDKVYWVEFNTGDLASLNLDQIKGLIN